MYKIFLFGEKEYLCRVLIKINIMKNKIKLNAVMNYTILACVAWVMFDPKLGTLIAKIHVSIAGLFLAYKILKK